MLQVFAIIILSLEDFTFSAYHLNNVHFKADSFYYTHAYTNWVFIERNVANYYKLVTLVHKLTAFELKMVGFADIYLRTHMECI